MEIFDACGIDHATAMADKGGGVLIEQDRVFGFFEIELDGAVGVVERKANRFAVRLNGREPDYFIVVIGHSIFGVDLIVLGMTVLYAPIGGETDDFHT